MTATLEKFRFIGTTDECVECQRCGKTELKSTVVLQHLDEDGNGDDFTYYGSTCAAKALGGKWTGRAVLNAAEKAQYWREQARTHHLATLAAYEPVEHSTVREQAAVYFGRNPNMRGKISASDEVARIIAHARQQLRPLV